jgi:hypothetical protein
MTPAPTLAWAIKAPDGRFIAVRLSQSHIDNLIEYLEATREGIAEGYRCVRVEVCEVSEG